MRNRLLFAAILCVATLVPFNAVGASPPDSDVSTTTFPPGYTGPLNTCPEGLYPQSYDPGAPCGPVDPCVPNRNGDGMGTTLWAVHPCVVETEISSTVAPSVSAGPEGVGQELTLPATGNEFAQTLGVLGIMAIVVGAGLYFSTRNLPEDKS